MKIINSILSIVFISFSFIACEEKMTENEIAEIGIKSCKKIAPYITKNGFDGNRSALSSNDATYKGVMLIQLSNNPNDTASIKRWQHPSWDKFGYMSSITTDDKGNSYTCPIPLVNTIDNPVSKINRVYKIDNETGEMKLFSLLPTPDTTKKIVPYGPLGVYFDCHASKIYVATVAGSTRDEENGVIYKLNQETGKIEDELKGFDAAGLCVGGITGTKRLFFGSTRTPNVYSIELSKKGDFVGKPQLEFTLDQLGPRGDDKARRIRFNAKGQMQVYGVEFNYNLTAASQKPETVYTFMYYPLEEKWHMLDFH